ncbi:hypothetical protein EYR40_008993 [Pleurotus pulmonarius]|nr:hypothetical protein EYR36_009815 [Pleurotus pulmonarius]KAF4594190.1 hypothetical protein EYR40_008993 [Pleurotus pulmonarius]
MAPVYVLDPFYLGITALFTTGYQLLGFAIAWTFQFDKITDFTGGSNFFLLALFTMFMCNMFTIRNIVASVFVMIWAIRIAGFLLYRVLKTGSDTRFDDIRSHFFKFLAFWIGQIVWVWTVSLPLTILNSPAISDYYDGGGDDPAFGTGRDIAGIVLWAIGLVIETTADIQKFRYKMSSSSPKDRPISAGLWGWSRHPPYFGEMLCWWGIWILCLSPTTNGDLSSSRRAAQYGAVVSPLFTFLLLMFASGVPTAEKPQAKKYYLLANGPDADGSHSNAWRHYKRYVDQTSILIPMPPVIYKRLPKWIKQTIFLDLPMYHFDEQVDGKAAVDEAKAKQRR